MTWKRGVTLWFMVKHEVHHRGQMTALMRLCRPESSRRLWTVERGMGRPRRSSPGDIGPGWSHSVVGVEFGTPRFAARSTAEYKRQASGPAVSSSLSPPISRKGYGGDSIAQVIIKQPIAPVFRRRITDRHVYLSWQSE